VRIPLKFYLRQSAIGTYVELQNTSYLLQEVCTVGRNVEVNEQFHTIDSIKWRTTASATEGEDAYVYATVTPS
jgi:hypothetical protein